MPRDFMRGGAFSNINVAAMEKNAEIGATVWTSEKVSKLLEDYAAGLVDIRGYKGSPFFMNDVNLRKPKLQFQYTKHEMRELRRCAKDPVYFARNYCQLFTEDGYIKVNLRDYQREVIKSFVTERFSILMASRQVGKCNLFISKLLVINKDGTVSNLPIYELWYGLLKKYRMVTIFSWLKYWLYKKYDLLANGR